MQKKTDKFLDKIVKKDYKNELEKVLENKVFDENTKSLLLNILYKIETAYKDYQKVKVDVENKEEFIQTIIDTIKNNCDEIKIVKLNSEESEILGDKTFFVEKNKKRIISYPIERKVLYCLSKISKKEKIIKDNYDIIDETLTDLINVGNNINTVEPMRDFNGYCWTTIPKEIESIKHNLIYQNIRILIGNTFLNNWIKNNEYIIDYMESFQNRLEEQYGKQNKEQWIEYLNQISVLLASRYNQKLKNKLQKEKREVERQLNKTKDNQEFVQEMTQEKRRLTKEIKQMDEMLNNKEMLQQEYEKRNEFLPLEQKIFSRRILSEMMMEEREEKLQDLEKVNDLLNPQKFVALKKTLESKEKYLELLEKEELDKEIRHTAIELQKIFLSCYQIKIAKIDTKQELKTLIYEFRYYCLLPFDDRFLIHQVEELENQRKEVERILIKKAHDLKLIDICAKEKEIDYEILKNIFSIRVIHLEDLYIKVMKEKESYYIQLFDEEVFEENIPMQALENKDKKEIVFKLNKKIKIFN